jgi:ribonuclease BN (tRNA processing enzyme)
MDVTILGSGTAIPSLRRGSPGLLVEVAGQSLLFDGGAGTLPKLLRAGVTVLDLDRVFYTHLHPDHTGDLVPLLFALRNPAWRRAKPLYITGPKGFGAYYEALVTLYGDWIAAKSYDLVLREVLGEVTEGDGFKVVPREVVHLRHSVCYRIESADGRSVVYSGDTTYCDAIIDASRGADLLVLECSAPDERPMKNHLTPTQAGQIAALAGCRRLVLTHFYPICEEYDIVTPCRKVFDGELILAEDLMRLAV